MKVFPGYNDPRELVIRLHAVNRVAADFVLDAMHSRMPKGYVWERQSLGRDRKPGKSSSGQRVSITFVIFNNDTREQKLTDAAAYELFGDLDDR